LLEGFGRFDYRPALYAYVVAPFTAIFGPDRLILATRFPAALLGTISVFALYGLVRRLDRPDTGLWAALLLAVSPWHIHLSRIGHEATLTPTLVIVGLYFLVRSNLIGRPTRMTIKPLRSTSLSSAAVVLGLTAHAYASMRVFVPAMLLVGFWIYRSQLITRWREAGSRRKMVIAVALVALLWAPMGYTAVTAWDHLSARSFEQSIFHQGWPLREAVMTGITQYVGHFGWRWLVSTGDPSIINSIPGLGQMAYVTMPLALLGCVGLLRTLRRDPGRRLLLAWGLAHPLAASLAISGAHALRSATGIGAFAWLAAIGVRELRRWLGVREIRTRALVTILVSVAILSNAGWTVHCLVRTSRDPEVQATYQHDFVEAVTKLRSSWRRYDRIFISDRTSTEHLWRADQLYVYLLLGLPVPPEEFQAWSKPIRYRNDKASFHVVTAAGPFVFTTRSDRLDAEFKSRPHDKVMIIGRPGDVIGGRLVCRVLGANGEIRFELTEVGPRQPR